ncbi:MAG: hypothetical protein KGI66_05055 [Patescibacteria group bacterium]|nr:hypothetical protein [Patescibacteria group bacterium]
MDANKVLVVINVYRRKFKAIGIGKVDYPHDEPLANWELGLEHCHGMLDKMEEFVVEGRMDKTFRWLGFIQGVLWSQKVYTLSELKDHNRPH